MKLTRSRPPQRGHRLEVRLSDDDVRALNILVEARKEPASAVVRALILEAAWRRNEALRAGRRHKAEP